MNNIFKLIFLAILTLSLMFIVTGCGCGDDDDDDDDDSDVDDDVDDDADDDADDDVDDDADDDDLPDSPVVDYPADETVTLPGLTGHVRVALDQYKIPYIFAENPIDLSMVVGYMTAEQRFMQMDFLRHLATGRLSEYLGDIAVGSDLVMRTIFMARNGQSVLDNMLEEIDADTQARIQAFADGVNAWLDEKRAEGTPEEWPSEFTFNGITPDIVPDWEVRDSLSIARYQVWDLSGTLNDEIELTQIAEALAGSAYPDLYETIFTRAMATDTTILQPGDTRGGNPANVPSYNRVFPEGYQGLQRTLEFMQRAEIFKPISTDGEASNNWIVSPDINGGIGYLANDPHLTLSYPAIWTPQYVDTKEFAGDDMKSWGVGIAGGGPAIIIGANEQVAWGETVAGYDVTDVYAEDLILEGDEPSAVNYDGGTVNLIKSTQEFKLFGSDEVELRDIYVVPHHGPILPDSIDGTTALSFRWTGHDPTFEVKAFLDLLDVTTVAEGFTALESFLVGAQNFIFQDTSGGIGYFPNARVPIRTWAHIHAPWHVLPGDGSAEWGDFIPTMQFPKITNPARGFLCTSNNDINGSLMDGDPTNDDYYWYFDRAIGYRAARVDDMLTEQSESRGFSMDSMKEIQLDVMGLYAGDIIPKALTIIGDGNLDLSTDAQAIYEYFRDWGYNLSSGLEGYDPLGPASADQTEKDNAVAAMAFGQFEILLKQMTFGDELQEQGLVYLPGWSENTVAMLHLIDLPDDPIWDDVSTVGDVETQQDIFVAALNQAAIDIPALSYTPPVGAPVTPFDGATVDEWYWGRMHHVVLEHMAFSGIGIPTFNKGPYAIPGGLYTVNVASYPQDGESFTTTKGPSLRIVNEFSAGEIKTHFHYPGGQIPVVDDPNDVDMMELWVAHEYYEFPHETDDILAATQYMIAFTGE